MLDCSPPTNGGAGGGGVGVVGTPKPQAWLVSLTLRVEVITIQRIITRSALGQKSYKSIQICQIFIFFTIEICLICKDLEDFSP